VRNGLLRHEVVIQRPEEKAVDRLAAIAAKERAARQVMGDVLDIDVIDHPDAPYGSWRIGDEVRVSVSGPWSSWSGWSRITGWRVHDGDKATLELARADSFTYGG